ncbi:MAG: hypothetical protein KAK00_07590 [Nanoarchaeota archaeon]|nr:hypothetical protein [Nanoarchaeota archaeon]
MKANLVDLIIDRNIRFHIIEKEVIRLLSSKIPLDRKIAIWKTKIAKFGNRAYYQDRYLIKTFPSRY